MDKLLNVNEMAKLLRISPKSAWRLIRNKQIGFYRIGQRRIAVSSNQIAEYLKCMEQQPVASTEIVSNSGS